MPNPVERWLSLLNVLIGADRAVTVDRIRQRVPGYPAEMASFQRQFERDKRALRDMGLPIETSEIPGSYPPEFGYRIPRDQAHLRDPGLAADELAALHLAASAIRLDGIEGSGGLWKLGGGPAPAGGDGVVDLPADPRLTTLFGALAERRVTTFSYRGAERSVHPWRLACTRGRWYLTGHDVERDAPRTFRLDRIGGDVTVGSADGFVRPAGAVAPVRMEAYQFGSAPPRTVRVLVDEGYDDAFRQLAPSAIEAEVRPDGAKVLTVEVTDPDAFRSTVLRMLDHAEILEPADLRDDLVQWVEAIAARAADPVTS